MTSNRPQTSIHDRSATRMAPAACDGRQEELARRRWQECLVSATKSVLARAAAQCGDKADDTHVSPPAEVRKAWFPTTQVTRPSGRRRHAPTEACHRWCFRAARSTLRHVRLEHETLLPRVRQREAGNATLRLRFISRKLCKVCRRL
jgi:hypothetical protein